MEVKVGLVCTKIIAVTIYLLLAAISLVTIIEGPVQSVIRNDTVIQEDTVKLQGEGTVET